jgi:type I restriction enzyme S subunit
MSWKKVKLGDFLKVRENRFKPNDKAIANLRRIDKIDFSGEIFISDKPSNTDMILVKQGDLVISGINVEKGAMAVYTGEDDITATIHYSSYSFDKNSIDIEFLKSFLKSIEFKNALKEQVPGGIKTEIKPKHLLPLIVEIPTDIEDQREVVKILQSRNSKVEAISTELTHQLSLVKKLRQQLLQDAVQGKLVPQNKNDEPASELLKKIKAEKAKLIAEKKLKKENDLPPIKQEEIPFDIPENWVWCRLGEISEIVRGGSPRPAGDPTYYGGEIPFLKVGDLTGYEDIYVRTHTHSIKEAGLHKTRFVEADTLMLTNSGATLGIPRICTFPTTFNDGIAAFLNLNSVNKLYLYYFLKSKTAWFLQEASRGQGQPNLNTDIIALTPVPLPPINEQQRITEILEQLMQNCNELEASIKESEIQNEKLLQQVLREALRKEK